MMRVLLAAASAGIIPAMFFAFRWFLLKTDVLVGYSWSWHGPNFCPNFDIRNLSGSRTYVLANIAYTKNNRKEILALDNTSLWGQELRPGTILHRAAAPLLKLGSPPECFTVEVSVRLQNGREIRAQGPGQLYTGFRRLAFAMRQRIEKASLPLPS